MQREDNRQGIVKAYLSLKTPEERAFAAGHVLWLRELAKSMRETDAAEADELEAAATDLEVAIQRAEQASK